MKLKSFRIKNYKSIIDSDECFVENDLTIFAGKNESGKTSILEALENFNADTKIPEEAKPINGEKKEPEIEMTFNLTHVEINEYYKKAGIDKIVKTDNNIKIKKLFPDYYDIDSSAAKLFEIDEEAHKKGLAEKETSINYIYKNIDDIHKQYFTPRGWQLFTFDLDNIATSIKQVETYYKNYKASYIVHIPIAETQQSHDKNIQDLIKIFHNYEADVKEIEKRWDLLIGSLPNFILFRSFEDIIPNEVPFSELEKSDFIKDLCAISDIDIKLIQSDDKRGKIQHHKKVNIKFNEEYSKFWQQDLTTFKLNWGNNILECWIEENDIPFKPSERSKGKQWHMSFYIKITARASEGKDNVILIDEPGLYLHASAQGDIYNKLIDRAKKVQILYTTHSPYLINRDELFRVRLVLKPDAVRDGTIIENKIHAKSDKETLTPILTAIGLGINDGVQNINQINNIVVEGPSDYFYLQGLKKIFDIDTFNFIYGGGSGNMGKVGAILSGWGCNVIYLFDNDQGLKDGSKNLNKIWLIKKELLLSVKDNAGAIEDVFSQTDFKNIILKNDEPIDKLNSEHIKIKGYNKVLLARQFNSNCFTEVIKFDEDTNLLVKSLFDKLSSAFN